MKKVLSLVLVIAMVLSSFSFAFAATFEDVDGDYEEAVGVLAALGVITGYEDGTFRPERIVTRAEMAKLIVEILGYGDLVAGSASNFADTQGHWADPWIALAAGRGLVIGTGDGNFVPDRQVSYDEAITMVVRALGYTDDCNELKNMTWPTNFKVKASELDLLDGVKSLAGGADRGGVAQLLFNALNAALVTVDADGNVTYIFDSLDKDTREARILLSRLAEKDDDFDVIPDHVDSDHKNYKGDVVDLVPYMYQNITVYEKDDVVVFVSDVNSLVLKGTVVDDVDDNNYFVVEDAKEDEYKFLVGATTESNIKIIGDTPVFLNGAEVDYEDIAEFYDGSNLEDAEVTVVLDGEDGDRITKTVSQKVVGIVARLATITVQAEEDFDEAEEEILAYPYNVVLPLDDDEIDYDRVVVKGDVDSLEDIEEDDVLTLFYAGGEADDDVKLEIIVSRDTVEGRLTRISGSDYTVGGKVYKLNKDSDLKDDLEAGDEGLFYLDYEGKLFAFDEEGSGKSGNYALVLDKTEGYQTTPGGVVLADPKVKLLTASGEEITYVLDTDLDVVNDKTGGEEGKVITVALDEGMVIEYDLDKNNVIDDLKVVTMLDSTEFKTNVNSFNLASNAVIFNLPSGAYDNTDDAAVIDEDELDDEITAKRFRNTKGEIEILVVIKGGAEVEGIFAMITKDDGKAYDEDEEKEVKLFTAYVDGVKVEYLAHKDEDKEPVSKSTNIVELTVSGGKLKAAEVITASAIGVANSSRVTNSITTVPVKVGDKDVTYTYFLADDVVIYVLKDDDGTLVFDKVGTKGDIRGKNFKVYDTVDVGDEDYDIVVVWP